MAFERAVTMPDTTAPETAWRVIARYNAQRALVARRMFFRLMIVVVPVIMGAAATIGIILTQGPGPSVYGLMIACFVLFCVGGTMAVSPSRQFQRDFRSALLPAVFDFVEDCVYRFRTDPAFMKTFPIDSLVEHVDVRHFYMLTGLHHGMRFTLTETEYVDNGDVSQGILFRGVVLQFELANYFPGTLIAVPQAFSARREVHNFFRRRNLGIVRSGDRKVDHWHEFRTDTQPATKMLVESEIKEVLYCIGRAWPDELVRLFLLGSTGYLLVTARKNVFEIPGIDQSIVYDTHLRPMIRELSSLLSAANSLRNAVMVKQEDFHERSGIR